MAGRSHARSRLIKLAPALALLLSACGKSEPASRAESKIETRNAPAAAGDAEQEASVAGLRRYVVALPIRACPNPNDYRESVDQLLKANPSHPLPGDCKELAPGTALLMKPAGQAPTAIYKDFVFAQAMLENGGPVWSDEFNNLSLKLAEGTRRGR